MTKTLKDKNTLVLEWNYQEVKSQLLGQWQKLEFNKKVIKALYKEFSYIYFLSNENVIKENGAIYRLTLFVK